MGAETAGGKVADTQALLAKRKVRLYVVGVTHHPKSHAVLGASRQDAPGETQHGFLGVLPETTT